MSTQVNRTLTEVILDFYPGRDQAGAAGPQGQRAAIEAQSGRIAVQMQPPMAGADKALRQVGSMDSDRHQRGDRAGGERYSPLGHGIGHGEK